VTTSKTLHWGRLFRLSLAPSAVVDVLAGLVFGAGGAWPQRDPAQPGLGWLVLATLGVYHGAMALNDWADREEDASTRPERPLPSGAISPTVAFLAGLGLVLVGVGVATWVEPLIGAAYAGLAVLAVGYDLFGRGVWLGPSLLGLCRAANLGIAITFGTRAVSGGWPDVVQLAPALGYGLYVFSLSRLGRLEDGQEGLEGAHPRGWILAAAASFFLICITPFVAQAVRGSGFGRLQVGPLLAIGVGLFVVRRLVSLKPSGSGWTPPDVGRCMGVLLRMLLACGGTVALLVLDGGLAAKVVVVVAALGYPISYQLRRVFPPS